MSGRELEEYLSLSPEREPSTHSLVEEEEEYEEDEKVMGDEDEEGEGEGEGEGESEGNDEGNVDEVECQKVGNGSRSFIIPLIWTVNDFYLTMFPNVFNKLRNRFQIPNSIPIRLSRKHERCYFGKTADVGMYDAMFTAGLRLPLTELHRLLANYLGLFLSQIALNTWRKFQGAKVI